jgi:arylsulfatase A-like enzyme
MGRKTNLLFIFTDQQRADTLGCYGNPLVQTPNLDRLAGQSVLFENAYITQPVCTPARSSIMTGLYPHANGCTQNNLPLRAEVPTIAEMVSPDFVRGYNGKWHLGDEVIPQHGFDYWLSVDDKYRSHFTREDYNALFTDYHHYLLSLGYEPNQEWYGAKVFARAWSAQLPEEQTKAGFQAREAARFIRENRDRPFILYVSFVEPHRPYYSPFDDLYPPEEVPVGPHFRQSPSQDGALVKRLMSEQGLRRSILDDEDPRTEAGCRKLRAKYLGMCTLVDRAVGQILHALDDSGQSENTIVIFTSDHGDFVGDHMLFGKSITYEGAAKVPLTIRVPWLREQPRRIAEPFSQIDLVPTLLDLLDEPVLEGLHGKSRVAVLQGETTLREQGSGDVFIEWNGTDGWPQKEKSPDITAEQWQRILGPWRTVIGADGWKLNLSPVDQCELYNLNDDPHEQYNLYDDPDQRGRVRDMAERIRRWQKRTADEAPLPAIA